MMMITTEGRLGSQSVTFDPYSPNPLAEDMRSQLGPEIFGLLASVLAPPKMFTGGTADLPAFTASGADPGLLLRLPAYTRHYAAGLASMAELLWFFEETTQNPMASVDCDGFRDARQRMNAWGSKSWQPERQMVPSQDSNTDDQLYSMIFEGAALTASNPDVRPKFSLGDRRVANSTLTASEISARAKCRVAARLQQSQEQ